MSATIVLVPHGDDEERLWRLVAEVAGLLHGLRWMLIGGLMVRLLEAEHGAPTSWTTVDVDAVVDPRSMSIATTIEADRLMAAGFEPYPTDEVTVYGSF